MVRHPLNAALLVALKVAHDLEVATKPRGERMAAAEARWMELWRQRHAIVDQLEMFG